jgi:hypothetical protein
MKSKRGYRDQKGVFGVCNWLKYYFQRFTCRNTGGGCKHIHQQAQHKITPPHQYCDNRFCVNWDRDVCTLDHCHFTAA